MTIDVRSPVFERLRKLTPTEVVAERDRLLSEARGMLERSDDGYLTADDQDRFDQVEADIEFLAHAHQQRERALTLYNTGGFEHGSHHPDTPPGGSQSRTRQLRGAQTLTRDQSLEQWTRDNGMSTHTTTHTGGFDQLLRGLVTGDWTGAEEVRAMSEGTLSAGGAVVPTPLAAEVLDLARNASQVFAAGATTVPMTSQTLKLPRLVGEGAPAWRSENAPITAGDLSFDTVTFTAKSLDRLVILSRELFEDSDPSAGDVISQAFAAQLALELDRAALRGTGTPPEPRGVLNTAGITSTAHGAAGTAIGNYDWLLDAAGAVASNNYTANAHIVAPRTVTSLQKLKDLQGAYLAAPQGLLPILPSKQVPTNLTLGASTDCSEIYTAQWNMLGIGLRTGFRIQFLQERYADNGQVAFVANLRADVQVLQAGAFALDTGVRG
ncbi:phage major capsid protein [Rhodococcus sp. ACS1]|uniref:phage major capsid protein n=1 Tax=Rhodococcus sp. ACS1 TaxID=2028570 RepID=UPI000BB14323|nr:phage major capsid protein [Rhodococcus sp. ACS1]PBC35023.1 phage major capsid protein [Rhodococcus sp. ACS1]